MMYDIKHMMGMIDYGWDTELFFSLINTKK